MILGLDHTHLDLVLFLPARLLLPLLPRRLLDLGRLNLGGYGTLLGAGQNGIVGESGLAELFSITWRCLRGRGHLYGLRLDDLLLEVALAFRFSLVGALHKGHGGARQARTDGSEDVVEVLLVAFRQLSHLQKASFPLAEPRLAVRDVGVLQVVGPSNQAAPGADLVVSPILWKVGDEKMRKKNIVRPRRPLFLDLPRRLIVEGVLAFGLLAEADIHQLVDAEP